MPSVFFLLFCDKASKVCDESIMLWMRCAILMGRSSVLLV
jgi:hypothetical protein